MKKLILPIVLIAVGGMLFISGCNNYNAFVEIDEDVENAWSKVQSAYQRRADLIPNLVNTVKGVADFEKSTLTAVQEARSKATSMNVDASNLNPEQIKQFQQAQSGLSQSLGRLLMVSERYPQLQANQSFRELQVQLEGTENRIKVARDRYNDVVTNYNKKIRRFPGTIYASMFGFDERGQFEAEASAQDAPEVNFD
ncbi:MAG: LemA family protein [Bacteroidetes bacterium]|jgi:LemA protein|nr:LemA family protein [Bacteroidota bacterium]